MLKVIASDLSEAITPSGSAPFYDLISITIFTPYCQDYFVHFSDIYAAFGGSPHFLTSLSKQCIIRMYQIPMPKKFEWWCKNVK